MPKDEKVDNKVSRIIKLEEHEEKNSKIIQQTNQRNLMSKTEISENKNSRLISLAKLEWQKLKLLLCPDEELTMPEFEIDSDKWEFGSLEFNHDALLYNSFIVGKSDWQSGKIRIIAELEEGVVNYMLCDSNNLGHYRLFKDILTHAIAKQLFLHRLQRSNEKYKNMHFDSSEFEDCETLKVPSESGWLIEHPDSGFIERLDLYVMNHPQFF